LSRVNLLKTKITKVKNHGGFRKYAKNTSWLIGEKVLRMGVSIFVGVWVARYLGPGQFGLLSYAQSFVYLFAIISSLGMDSIIVRDLLRNENSQEEILGTSFFLKFAGAIIMFPLLYVGLLISGSDAYTNLLVFIIAGATIFQSFNVIDYYFQAKVQVKYTALANIYSLAISSVVKIVLILTNAPLIAFALIFAFDAILLASGFIYYYYSVSSSDFRKWRFRMATAIRLVKEGWPLMLSTFLISIYMKFDQIMLKELMDAEAVGQYSAAVRLSETWYFIPMALSSSLFPAIVNAKNSDQELYKKRFKMLYRLMFWIALGIAIPITLLSDYIVAFLYGDEFYLVGPILSIHIWAGIFVFLGVALNGWLIVENLQKYTMVNMLIGVITNIVLNYFLIQSMGAVGAAWATLLSYAFGSYLCFFFFKPTREAFLFATKSFLTFK